MIRWRPVIHKRQVWSKSSRQSLAVLTQWMTLTETVHDRNRDCYGIKDPSILGGWSVALQEKWLEVGAVKSHASSTQVERKKANSHAWLRSTRSNLNVFLNEVLFGLSRACGRMTSLTGVRDCPNANRSILEIVKIQRKIWSYLSISLRGHKDSVLAPTSFYVCKLFTIQTTLGQHASPLTRWLPDLPFICSLEKIALNILNSHLQKVMYYYSKINHSPCLSNSECFNRILYPSQCVMSFKKTPQWPNTVMLEE